MTMKLGLIVKVSLLARNSKSLQLLCKVNELDEKQNIGVVLFVLKSC